MGMFDTFVDEETGISMQVKCFYRPIFSDENFFDLHTYHSGGRLAEFSIGDKLPLQTIYYKYPQEFCIIDEDEEYQVVEIRDGKFYGFIKKVEHIPNFYTNFYSHDGGKIIAKNKKEIIAFTKAIREERHKPMNERNFINFWKLWFEQLTYDQELGELFECFQFAKKMVNDDFMGSRMMVELVAMTSIIEEYREKQPDKFKALIKKHNIKWGE